MDMLVFGIPDVDIREQVGEATSQQLNLSSELLRANYNKHRHFMLLTCFCVIVLRCIGV